MSDPLATPTAGPQTLRERFLDQPRTAATDAKVVAVVMRDADTGMGGSSAEDSDANTLPRACRAEQIVWSTVRGEIAQMLSQSDLISEVLHRFSPDRKSVV